MDKIAPIVLFVYNRTEHTRRTTEALLKNSLAANSSLFVFSDGPKNVNDEVKVRAVRDLVTSIKGFSKIEIVFRDKNLGLANSVISGVSEVFKFNDRVIVIEDDVLTSPSFLSFMNKALQFYREEKQVFSLSGYPYPVQIPESYRKDVFISYRASSWGWATWKNRWEKVDWDVKDFRNFISDKKAQELFNRGGDDLTPMLKAQLKGLVDSWAIRWSYAHFKNDGFCLYPTTPLCKNIGTDRSGTHSSSSKKLSVKLEVLKSQFEMVKNPELNEDITLQMQKLFRLSLFRRIINFIKLS